MNLKKVLAAVVALLILVLLIWSANSVQARWSIHAGWASYTERTCPNGMVIGFSENGGFGDGDPIFVYPKSGGKKALTVTSVDQGPTRQDSVLPANFVGEFYIIRWQETLEEGDVVQVWDDFYPYDTNPRSTVDENCLIEPKQEAPSRYLVGNVATEPNYCGQVSNSNKLTFPADLTIHDVDVSLWITKTAQTVTADLRSPAGTSIQLFSLDSATFTGSTCAAEDGGNGILGTRPDFYLDDENANSYFDGPLVGFDHENAYGTWRLDVKGGTLNCWCLDILGSALQTSYIPLAIGIGDPPPAPSWQAVGENSARGGGISANSGDSGFPATAVSPGASVPFVAWQDDSSGDYEIYLRQWSGNEWKGLGGSASGGGLSQNGGQSQIPYVAVGANERPYVVWQDDSSGRFQVYLRYWNGSSWQQIGSSGSGGGLSNSSRGAREPSIAIGADGRPYVAYRNQLGDGNWEIYLKTWNGSIWRSLGNSASGGGISNSSGYSGRPIVATAPNGDICVSWHDGSVGNLEIYVRCWDGSNWIELDSSASEGGISNNRGNSAHSTIILGTGGRPTVTWHDDSSGDNEIYLKRWTGSSWVQLSGSAMGGGISNNSGSSVRPTLALGPGNRPHVAWQDNSSGDNEIYTTYWDVDEWVAHESGSASGGGISNNSGSSERPSLAIGPDGVPTVAWFDDSSGDGEIYVKRWK